MSSPPDHLRHAGVYYAPRDYAGFARRLLIMVIDFAVLMAVWCFLALWHGVVWAVSNGEVNVVALVMLAWVVLAYVYLTLVAASPIGTLGFLLTGVKIVTLKGERPSLMRMTYRLCCLLVLPWAMLIDLLWMTGEEYQQTLKDKFAETCVVRKNAVPIGRARLVRKYQTYWGRLLVHDELDRRQQS